MPPTSIQAAQAVEVPWVTGAAVMLRTAALRQTGLFDDGFFLYFEETDLMRRLRRAGWAVWHEPAARVVHAGGAATQIRDPGTGLPHAKRMPRYWYESHRRYFALAGGSGAAIAAGLAFSPVMRSGARAALSRRASTAVRIAARAIFSLMAGGLAAAT